MHETRTNQNKPNINIRNVWFGLMQSADMVNSYLLLKATKWQKYVHMEKKCPLSTGSHRFTVLLEHTQVVVDA